MYVCHRSGGVGEGGKEKMGEEGLFIDDKTEQRVIVMRAGNRAGPQHDVHNTTSIYHSHCEMACMCRCTIYSMMLSTSLIHIISSYFMVHGSGEEQKQKLNSFRPDLPGWKGKTDFNTCKLTDFFSDSMKNCLCVRIIKIKSFFFYFIRNQCQWVRKP